MISVLAISVLAASLVWGGVAGGVSAVWAVAWAKAGTASAQSDITAQPLAKSRFFIGLLPLFFKLGVPVHRTHDIFTYF